MEQRNILKERRNSIAVGGKGDGSGFACEKQSVSGAVSQRACVYCGARVVLNPITDAYHIVHGPIGCASYTWDIRGSLSSGSDLYRNSFSTDLRETDIVFGGAKKLTAAIDELMETADPRPKLIFVYATCIVGVIGDDIEAVCRMTEEKYGIRAIPVKAPGFSGTKSQGYQLACNAILELMRPHIPQPESEPVTAPAGEPVATGGTAGVESASHATGGAAGVPETAGKPALVAGVGSASPAGGGAAGMAVAPGKRFGINILGDYNLAGEMWIIKGYMAAVGIPVIATITGDSSYDKLIQAPTASLNIVQCAGSAVYLAESMEAEMGIPYVKVSFFGVEDTCASIVRVADALGDPDVSARARAFVKERSAQVMPIIERFRPKLEGKKAAIFVGGGYKAISLIRQFNELGMRTVVVGTQTGKKDEYEVIGSIVQPDTIILDDANPAELEQFMLEKEADILVGGVKERPLAYKLGIAFCDHNHERKAPLAGFEGIDNFVREINASINSPVWRYLDKNIEKAKAAGAA
ncbi:MAG: nitrogenase iron-molybdenum cofactor biosynthesis protein NifE [Lachnospiraceae bacterium]|jgi:nitrogenase molybdenum-cofactor synthesis protein NifE|nr:nitrogenase iron-molybdenum cofactor biosynthesis protein NifE [Lachnospiraceae bacterium]